MTSELRQKREDEIEFTLTIKSHNLGAIINLFRQDQPQYTPATETAESLMEGMSEQEKQEILSPEPPKSEPVKEPEPANKITMDQLQAAAQDAVKRLGARGPIKEMLKNFGVKKLTDIQPADYAKALKTLEGLNNA